MPDVVIVGAGVAGCACARELAKYQLDVLVIEAGYDLACGASRTNSGIVHGGYDPIPGTNKALYNVRGAQRIPQLAEEIGFRFKPNGSMVAAFSEEELHIVEELQKRAVANGVSDVEVVGKEQALAYEPNLSPEVQGALVCASSGICDPFGMTVAFAENARMNGVAFKFLSPVAKVSQDADKSGWSLTLDSGEVIHARVVINAAGAHAIELHNQVSQAKLESRPRLGEYVLMSRDMGTTFTHTMFRAPGPRGKGVLVSPTVEGNLIIGPDALDVESPSDTATRSEGLAWVVEQAQLTWPGYVRNEVITNFAGVRPSGADGDFVIGEPNDAPGFFDIAAFDSPGLTSAPAVALDIAEWVANRLQAHPNPNFNPYRACPPRLLEMDDKQRAAVIEKDSRFGHIVCRCEQVSEAEILAAIHAPLPATSVSAVRRRCRAGMGKCQGGFCLPYVAEIIARETGVDVSEVRMAGPGSELGVGRIGEVVA